MSSWNRRVSNAASRQAVRGALDESAPTDDAYADTSGPTGVGSHERGGGPDLDDGAEDGLSGEAIRTILTDTLVETPDMVAVFASVGHEALWANDAFVTIIPIRASDKLSLVELLDEWSRGHFEVKVLPGPGEVRSVAGAAHARVRRGPAARLGRAGGPSRRRRRDRHGEPPGPRSHRADLGPRARQCHRDPLRRPRRARHRSHRGGVDRGRHRVREPGRGPHPGPAGARPGGTGPARPWCTPTTLPSTSRAWPAPTSRASAPPSSCDCGPPTARGAISRSWCRTCGTTRPSAAWCSTPAT